MKIALAALLLATPALATNLELQNDPPHTSASFSVKHMMINTVHGDFGKVSSTINWDKDDPTKSAVEVKIEAASVDTRNDKRDADLKSPNFFDAAKCPEIAFKSTKVEKAGADKYKLTGDLTMHCQTHPVTLDATFTPNPIKTPWGTQVYAANATGSLKRSEWGLVWNKALEAGGVVVSDDVSLQIDAEYLPKPAAKKEAAVETQKK